VRAQLGKQGNSSEKAGAEYRGWVGRQHGGPLSKWVPGRHGPVAGSNRE
jgi:hypothetical protein